MNTKCDLTDNEWHEIGNRIKSRRKSVGMKQGELAEAIGISITHMSSIENGKQHPSLYVIIKISECLNTTPDYFLLGQIRTNNVPMNIVDSLKLCDENDLPLINSLIECVRKYRD